MTPAISVNTSASGLIQPTYDELEDIIEAVVLLKKNKYQFPGVDSEDLSQDIRLMCWDCLSRYDINKVGRSIFNYLARHVDNRLYNQFRGVYLHNNPPCLRCPEYIKETKSCRINEVGCDRIKQYRAKMARKRNIAQPFSYHQPLDEDNGVDFTSHCTMSVESSTGVCDLDDSFRSVLEPELIPYYENLVSGRPIPDKFRLQIQRRIKVVLDDI